MAALGIVKTSFPSALTCTKVARQAQVSKLPWVFWLNEIVRCGQRGWRESTHKKGKAGRVCGVKNIFSQIQPHFFGAAHSLCYICGAKIGCTSAKQM